MSAATIRSRRFQALMIIGLTVCLLPAGQAATLYLVRHAEKQSDQSDPELTTQGQCRAVFLAELLHASGIEEVFSTDYRRTQATAMPLANRLGVEVTRYDPRQLELLAKQLADSTTDTLVVGHSNTTPELVRLLGGSAADMPETDYQRLYQISIGPETVQSHLFMMPMAFDPATCGQDNVDRTKLSDTKHH